VVLFFLKLLFFFNVKKKHQIFLQPSYCKNVFPKLTFPNILSRLSLINSLSPARLSLSVLCAGSHRQLSLSGDALCCSLFRRHSLLFSAPALINDSSYSLSLSASLLQPSLRSSHRSLLQHKLVLFTAFTIIAYAF
jgi:hypothetical protein